MARLDVSDIVLDPDFADQLTLYRNKQTVGENGRAINTTVESDFWGVVTAASGANLARMPSGEMVSGAIIVHSKTPLSSGAPGKTADIIGFRGRQYTVSRVDNYSHFGAGFTAATCEIKEVDGLL